MRKIYTAILTFICLSAFLFGCKSDKTVKISSSDPFKNTIVKSQFKTINGKEDNIVEGEQGTILVCPKGCFVDKKGNIVDANINIELSEALTLEDMLLSNLTTTSEGKLLETDGMIYFNATTADGEQLFVNKKIPVHIEIPTNEKKPGMMAYKGTRDDAGNMNWTDPKPIDNFLKIVDMDMLDFLPEGFAKEVETGLPYKNYTRIGASLIDSLYYSMQYWIPRIYISGFTSTNYNEPYYNQQNEVINGKYTERSFLVDTTDENDDSYRNDAEGNCGIDPALIKVIRSEKYQNTCIATKEFESRLKILYKTCNTELVKIYLDNLDKNLYEVDSLVAMKLKGTEWEQEFIKFMLLRQTKVKDAEMYAEKLNGYYQRELEKVNNELENEHNKLIKELQKKNEAAEKVADDYKKLLFKRETYRMEKYGFDWTETGWVNIDKGPFPKTYESQTLEITMENGKNFDRVYTYVIYTSLKSLYRLNSSDNYYFYAGNTDNNNMYMPKQKPAVAIAIGYKNEIPAIAIKEFITGSEPELSLQLKETTFTELKKMLSIYNKYQKENAIDQDLKFMAKMYEEKQRQKELKEEDNFLNRLYDITNPCCKIDRTGQELFEINCQRCHLPTEQEMTGPGLAFATSRHSEDWLYKWTTDATAMIAAGDPDALELFKRYNSVQPAFKLSQEEVRSIYAYIDSLNKIKN